MGWGSVQGRLQGAAQSRGHRPHSGLGVTSRTPPLRVARGKRPYGRASFQSQGKGSHGSLSHNWSTPTEKRGRCSGSMFPG